MTFLRGLALARSKWQRPGRESWEKLTLVALTRPLLARLPSSGYSFVASASIASRPSPACPHTAARTLGGPRAPRPRTAPSYRPTGRPTCPPGGGTGGDLSACVRVDTSPARQQEDMEGRWAPYLGQGRRSGPGTGAPAGRGSPKHGHAGRMARASRLLCVGIPAGKSG